MSRDKIPVPDKETITGIKIARWTGRILGIGLIAWGIYALASDFLLRANPGLTSFFKSLIFIGLGSLYLFPWKREITDRLWKRLFLLLILVTAIFVFTLMASVMSEHIAIAQAGQKAPPPMIEGALLFLVLIQVPTILFERNPHWLN